MRAIGAVATEQDARRLSSHLLTLGIGSYCDRIQEGYCVWIRDEDKVAQARQELAAFLANPADPRYDGAITAAEQIQARQKKADDEYRRNVQDIRNRWRRPSPQRCPLTLGLIFLCVVVAVSSQLGQDRFGPVLKYLLITQIQDRGDMIAWYRGLLEIRDGQVWRLVTPIFIHFGPIHLVFNLWYFFSIGGVVETTRGWWRFALLILVTAIISNLAQYLWSGPSFGGMSGVLYGLFGYVWMKARYDPGSGMYLHPDTITLMVLWLFICMTGYVGPIANAAHVGGFVTGLAIGVAPVLWRRFLR